MEANAMRSQSNIQPYISNNGIRRINHHLTKIIGTANVLEHAIHNETFLILQRVILLSICLLAKTRYAHPPDTIIIATPNV